MIADCLALLGALVMCAIFVTLVLRFKFYVDNYSR